MNDETLKSSKHIVKLIESCFYVLVLEKINPVLMQNKGMEWIPTPKAFEYTTKPIEKDAHKFPLQWKLKSLRIKKMTR